ncbi:MAG: VOC family protein [Solirubrobacteraceae bacterium]
MEGVVLTAAEFAVPARGLEAIERFYVERLGLAFRARKRERLQLVAGPATLGFVEDSDESAQPFHHFALLVPGNRFEAARAWLAEATTLLSRPGEDATTFEFESWDARACYGHDPSANIVELIAHRGVEESDCTGPFSARELRGLSEVGLVGTGLAEFVHALRPAGLELWSGEVGDGAGSLGFVGRQAHTLILCSQGRPWLPTGRPAESHPVTVTVTSDNGSTVVAGVSGGALVCAGPRILDR